MNRSSKLTGDKFESVKTYIIPSNLFWLLTSINDNFYAEKKNTVPEYLHVLVYICNLTCETYYLEQNLIYFAAEKKIQFNFSHVKYFFNTS